MFAHATPMKPAPALRARGIGLRLHVGPNAFGNALGNSIAYGDWGGSQQTAELKTAWSSQSSGSGGGAGGGASGPGEIDSHALELARLDGQATAELALRGALGQVPAKPISMPEVLPSLIDASLGVVGEEPGRNGRNGLIWNTEAVSYGVDLSSPQSRQLSANELGPVIVKGALQWPVGSEGWMRQQEIAQALQQPMFAPDDLIGAPIKLGAKGIAIGAGAVFGTMKNAGSKEISVLLKGGADEISGGTAAGTRLTFDSTARAWTTPEGVIYGQGSAHGNRIKHVLDHTVPNPTKTTHTLFNVERKEVLGLIDEAWKMKGAPLPNDPGAYVVPMGRAIGVGGEANLKIIVRPGTNQIITAYPK